MPAELRFAFLFSFLSWALLPATDWVLLSFLHNFLLSGKWMLFSSFSFSFLFFYFAFLSTSYPPGNCRFIYCCLAAALTTTSSGAGLLWRAFFLVATTIGAIPFRALLWTAEWMSGEFSTSQSQDTTWPLAPAPPLELMTVSVNSLIYDCARMAFAAFFSKLSHNNNSNSNACTHSFTYFSNVARSRAR